MCCDLITMASPLVSELGIRKDTNFYHTRDGYSFHKYKEVNGVWYLRCTDGNCYARGILRDGFELRYGHNHDPSPEIIQYRRQRRLLVVEAAVMPDSDAKQFLSDRTTSAFPDLLNYEHLKSSIQRERLSNLPDEPQSIEVLYEIITNPMYQSVVTTSAGETLFWGSKRSDDESTSILLTSRRCAEILKILPSLYTFSLTLPIQGTTNLFQLHVIGAVLDGYSTQLAFLLLEKDTLLSYACGLSLLREKITPWQCKNIICPNDTVANAYRLVFGVVVDFSMDQYILEVGKLAKSLLPEQKVQEQDPDTKSVLELCCGLPVVPQNLLPYALNMLKQDSDASTDELVQHVFRLLIINIEVQWLRSPLKGPSFSVSGNRERTSDAMESAMDRTVNHIPDSGIRLYTFLNCLKRMEDQSAAMLQRMSTISQPRVRRSYSLSEESEIITLTNILSTLHGDLSVTLKNLMRVATAKRWHIVLKSLK